MAVTSITHKSHPSDEGWDLIYKFTYTKCFKLDYALLQI